MVDPVRTLDPSLGLVSRAAVYLPNEVGLWRTVAYLANGLQGGIGLSGTVGAFDVSRRLSMTRGAGEAVERFALAPVPADSDYLVADNVCPERRIDFAAAGLGDASAKTFEFPWYRATDLLTGAESHVPAPAVDYSPGKSNEGAPVGRFFDPSPNGAAAGPSEHFAKVAGVAEILERDAFLWAWELRPSLEKFRVDDIADGCSSDPETRSFVRLLEAARVAGVAPTLAFVPDDGGPLETAVCVILGGERGRLFGSVGIKASAHPISALRGALQEGLQIRELFRARAQRADVPRSTMSGFVVTNDESRADFWTMGPAIAELRAWVQSFRALPMPRDRPAPDLDALVKYLAEKGISAHWVSLTHRLPSAIQELGWEAGKAICPGAFPLTMNESKGLSAVLTKPDGRSDHKLTTSMPHPLI
ncbi:YcaO-like family protein [Sinomonas susongensis]|uniref:YcaO-like family protein n=1 Tax=Sinomonas susongensis TaxID=1324851 RepID=UPI001FE4A8AD|nr:YcaO-like family protein [Sinomonas susongensis]